MGLVLSIDRFVGEDGPNGGHVVSEFREGAENYSDEEVEDIVF